MKNISDENGKPSQAELDQIILESLIYDPISGDLVWRRRPRSHFDSDGTHKAINGRWAGKVAGFKYKNGQTEYRNIQIANKTIPSHRIAWFLFHGRWPNYNIDHIDGNGLHNAIHNLRDVDQQENCRNRRVRHDSTSGYTGVSQHHRSGKWMAYISTQNGRKWLGEYDTPEAAYSVRREAEIKEGYHPNHGRQTSQQTLQRLSEHAKSLGLSPEYLQNHLLSFALDKLDAGELHIS